MRLPTLLLCLALAEFTFLACGYTTPADRARMAIEAVKAACVLNEKQPADMPPELAERLNVICPELELRDSGE